MLTLLNSAVITAPGTYRLAPLSVETARRLVRARPWQSAIGHAATAQLVSELLGLSVPWRRIAYRQEIGADALVFRLDRRAPEGVVLTRAEIEEAGYGWTLLTRLA